MINETEFLLQYMEHFNMHYKLLLRRYKRFMEIDDIHSTDIDVITYLDIIIVQLRAMCIERADLKKNYTAQNLLRLMKRDDLAQKIDDMLAEQFFSYRDNCDIRKALKILADNYICHYDAFEDDGIAWAEIIEKQLRNPYDEHNLGYIMRTVIDCIGEGLSLETLMNAIGAEDDIEEEDISEDGKSEREH
ncbi:MAG: hypothetical protein J6I76_07695 [Oribacterium sp.]|nr:hypothetical protein [Oribacterium sp.]